MTVKCEVPCIYNNQGFCSCKTIGINQNAQCSILIDRHGKVRQLAGVYRDSVKTIEGETREWVDTLQ